MFARASWGIDYHDILRERLDRLIAFIKEQAQTMEEQVEWRFAPASRYRELVDVAAAQRVLALSVVMVC